MNWTDVLPPPVAELQIRWEKDQSILRARRKGAKVRDIAAKLGVCATIVRKREKRAERQPLSPALKWSRCRLAVAEVALWKAQP